MQTRIISRLVVRTLVLALVGAGAWSVLGATYYVSKALGNDSNSGTSKASPWAKAPQMRGFGGSYSHVAGDRFIFRGGETWVNSDFQMAISQGGSSNSNRDYFGVDQTWFAGGSWTRPLFDAQGINIGGFTGGAQILISASNITIDGIELANVAGVSFFDGAQWQIQNGAMNIVMGGTFLDNITITNAITRDWRIVNQSGTIYTSGEGWDGNGIGGIGILSGNWGGNILVTDTIAHQSGVNQKSGCAFRQIPWVRRSRVWDTTQAVLGGYKVEYCEFFNFPDPTDKLAHNNAIETFSPAYIFGNLIHDLSNYTAPMLVAADWGTTLPSAPTYIINNVLWNVGWQLPIGLDTGGNPSQSEFYVWNNTVHDPGPCVGTTGRNATPYEKVDIRGNLFIAESNPITMPSPATTFIEGNNVTLTFDAAAAAGYSIGNLFQPVSGSAPTVDAGANLSAFFTTDRLGNPRDVPFDAGAYQWSGIPTPGIVAFEQASLTTAEDTTLTVRVVRTGGSSETVNVNYATANGTALSGTDYTATSGSLSLGNGVINGTFDVPILRNVAHTGNRYFTISLTLGTPTGGASLGAPSEVTVTIVDSDPPSVVIPELGLSFAASEMLMLPPFENNGGLISQPIETPSTNAAGKLMANFVVTVAGTYAAKFGVNAAHGGANSFHVQVNGTNDIADIIPFTSGIETRDVNWRGSGQYDSPQFWPMEWTFSAPTTNLLVIYGLEAGTVITNIEFSLQADPPPPPQQVMLGTSTASVFDAGVSISIPVIRVGSAGAVSVQYATANGSAIAGTDYTATSGTLNFADGETNKVVAIPVTNHPTYQGSKDFTLTLSVPSGVILSDPTVCTITIQDDLDPPLPYQATIVSVSAQTVPNPSYFTVGGLIPLTVNVSSNVTVAGTPQIILNTGAVATYASGSGSSNLVFNYTVGAGQHTQLMDYLATDSLVLNGGSIKSGDMDALLTLPTPGQSGSISDTQVIVVDTTAPAVTIGNPVAASLTGPIVFPVTYSSVNFNVSTLDVSDVTVNKTGTADVGLVTVSGSGTSWFVNLITITGTGTLRISISAGTATDLAGNVSGPAGPSEAAPVETVALTIIRDGTIKSGSISGP